jgi:hypothetical protein
VQDKIKVLYVLGIYRSGTTILSNLLGQMEGFCSVGELRAAWRELRQPGALCGCGQPLTSCNFWVEVLETAFGSLSQATEQSVLMKRWQDTALGQTHTWSRLPAILMSKWSKFPKSQELLNYGSTLTRVYQAVARVSGAQVIVDSSKEATDGALLGFLPEIEPTFVQIVRDPRGVAYSSLQRTTEDMDRFASWRHSAYAALSWNAGNLAGSAVRRQDRNRSTMLLRYEDFTADPTGSLERIAALTGVPGRAPTEGESVELSPSHTIAGNERFRTGAVRIQQDTQWRTKLSALDRATVTALSLPLIERYRYPWK